MARTVKEYLLNQAAKLNEAAEREGRANTPDEKKQIETLLAQVKEVNDAELLRRAFDSGNFDDVPPETLAKFAQDRRAKSAARDQIAELMGPAVGGGVGFAGAVKAAGFHLREQPSVNLSTVAALGVKASSFMDADEWNITSPLIVPQGEDRRWLFRSLPTVDAGAATAISDFTQTDGTLTGTVKRALDATSDKADLEVTLEYGTEELAQFAVTVDAIPNALMESISGMTQFLNGKGQFEVEKAIDAHVVAQIQAANPDNGAEGDDLIEQLRNAVAAMRAAGANPRVLAIDPSDAVDLDLSTSGDGTPYLFPVRDTGTSSPLWGLTVVESVSMIGEDPILIDPMMLGSLYLGRMRFDADPYTGFKKNLTTLRVETKGLFHVRDIAGAYTISAGS